MFADENSRPEHILIVDDSRTNLSFLSSILEHAGYTVLTAADGAAALRQVCGSPPALVLLDVDMPDMDGFEVCRLLKGDAATRDIPVVFISAMDDVADKIRGFKNGGVDYITKPFQFEEVMARVSTQLELRQARRALEKQNRDQKRIIEEQVEKISSFQLATIFALAKLADSKDHDTGAHLENTQVLCKALSERLSSVPRFQSIIDKAYIKNLSEASALHDIGKVGIRDAILKKNAKLTADEFDEMKKHTTIGANALREVDEKFPDNELIRMGIRIAESHHEKWDGSGYLQGLAGEDIPLEARILAVVDVYEALTSVRPYKKAYTHAESCAIISSSRGTHFDPVIVDAFESITHQFARIKGVT